MIISENTFKSICSNASADRKYIVIFRFHHKVEKYLCCPENLRTKINIVL